MSKTDSLHYLLCKKGASFIHNPKNQEIYTDADGHRQWASSWRIVTVEMVTGCNENCDIWGTNGSESVVVEVKTSHADFLADQKKWHRQENYRDLQSGNFRYYLAPEGLISLDELPDGWGLLEWDGTKITKVKQAVRREVSNWSDLLMMSSILRRFGIVSRVLNFREKQ